MLMVVSSAVVAAETDELTRRCWTESTFARTFPDLREPTAVSFGNLRDGDVLRAPFWIEFGIRGMGVIPAGNPNEKAGHHHLLVDTPLPVDPRASIPFSDTHRHFGKGQTGALIDLPPGRHTLRLLFADHDHRPYFVFSPEIAITVEGRRNEPAPFVHPTDFADSCRRWLVDQMTAPRPAQPHVYLRNVRAQDVLSRLSSITLGVVGFGVAPVGKRVASTGHFVLTATGRNGAVVARKDLIDGRTETVLQLERGNYVLQPEFVDADGKTLLMGEPVPVQVNGLPKANTATGP